MEQAITAPAARQVGELIERVRRPLGFALACAALIAVQWRENVKVRELDTAWVEMADQDAVRWNPQLVRILSLGEAPLVTDWMWLRTLQDVDLSHVTGGKHPSIYYDLILATELDPAYFEGYTVGANLLSIVRDDNSGALELIRRAQEFARSELPALGPAFAQRFWNPPWVIPMTRAYLELFEFSDLPAATEAFTEASRMPGSPPYLKHLVGRLSTRAGQYEVGASLLQFMLETTTANAKESESAREKIRRKIRAFRISRFLYQTNASFEEFLAGRKRKVPDQRALADFLAKIAQSDRDPEGGQLKLDDKGRIITTTPHERVLGMGD